MSPRYIPQEILDCIIDELQHDTRALIRCALVSHSFLPSSQRQLFSAITLECTGNSGELCKKLYLALTINSQLSWYIETLTFRLFRGSQSEHTQIFSLTFALMHNLRVLTLCAYSEGYTWNELPEYAREASNGLLRLPNLNHVTVKGISGFPMSTITRCDQLKGLSIYNTTIARFDRGRRELSDLPLTKGQLEFLSGDDGESGAIAMRTLIKLLAQKGSLLGLSNLHRFTAAVWSDKDVGAYQRVLYSSAKSLESLMLSVGCIQPLPVVSLDISTLGNLRHLYVSIFEHLSSPRWLLNLIASLPEHNRVEDITMQTFSSDFNDAAWEEIDMTLTKPRYARLRIVTLRYWRQQNQNLLPETRFPRLLTRGIFAVFHECDRIFLAKC